MSREFILEFSAQEIIAEGDHDRIESWLYMAAFYVVSLEAMEMELASEEAYKGFRDGWRMIYEANLTQKSMDEYLKEVKPGFTCLEILPRAI